MAGFTATAMVILNYKDCFNDVFIACCSLAEAVPRIQIHTLDTVEACTHEVNVDSFTLR